MTNNQELVFSGKKLVNVYIFGAGWKGGGGGLLWIWAIWTGKKQPWHFHTLGYFWNTGTKLANPGLFQWNTRVAECHNRESHNNFLINTCYCCIVVTKLTALLFSIFWLQVSTIFSILCVHIHTATYVNIFLKKPISDVHTFKKLHLKIYRQRHTTFHC